MVTENKAETKEGANVQQEVPKPRIQDSPEFKQALSESTSKDQRRLAEANKSLKTAQKQIGDLTSRMTQIEHEAEVARLGGDDDEGRGAARKLLELKQELQKRSQELETREERATGLERQLAIKSLTAEYGIPASELEDLETAAEMDRAALLFALNKAKTSPQNGRTETEPERESKKVEASDGRVGSQKIPNPITEPEAYAKYLAAVRASPEYRARVR